MDHVRKLPTAFTPFSKSGVEKKDVEAVQAILDKYVQPQSRAETPAKLATKKKHPQMRV